MREDEGDPVVASVPVEQLVQKPKVLSFTEEEAMAMQNAETKISAPRVSLQYSQLVYVPKTLPKTFSQKLAERAHPRVLWARLFAKLILVVTKLKVHVHGWMLQVRESIITILQRLIENINLMLSKCKAGLVNRLGGIKNKCSQFFSKVKLKLLSFKLPDFTRLRINTQSVETQGVGVMPSVESVGVVESDSLPIPLALTRNDKPSALALLTISLKKLPQQLRNLRGGLSNSLNRITAMPRQFIQNEAIADRTDVVSVYGLFAESKGNYFIYTIKSITASVLAKRG
jgi:hypothetical protein